MNNRYPLNHNRCIALYWLFGASLLCLSGCDLVPKLRNIFNPTDSPNNLGKSSMIAITIEPSRNIEVFLDGEPVATQSPFVSRPLKAEKHQVHIEAVGYHPFSVALKLTEGQKLEFPITLRLLNTEEGNNSKRPPAKENKQAKAPKTGVGIKPAQLLLQTDPRQEIEWDGDVLQKAELTLNRMWGTLKAGPIFLQYRYNQVGILEFILPNESGSTDQQAKWLVNRKEKTTGSSFRIPRGATHIIRMPQASMRQILTITRP